MMQMLIEQWERLEPRLREAITSAPAHELSSVRCCAPLPRPGQLVCLAGNYIEPQKPERGVFNAFLKSPNAVIGHDGTVILPDTDASFFHFEPEPCVPFRSFSGVRFVKISPTRSLLRWHMIEVKGLSDVGCSAADT